tara:strand:- start:119 stop:889 length:771 start_codon:yes stop_codon:yes gene_type:complete
MFKKLGHEVPEWFQNPIKDQTFNVEKNQFMLNFFNSYCKHFPIRGLEVGVLAAQGSTKLWLNNCLAESTFFLIDEWDSDISDFFTFTESADKYIHLAQKLLTSDFYSEAILTIKEIQRRRWEDKLDINIVRGKSDSVMSFLPTGVFDFIYLDGNHLYEGVKRDIIHSKRLVNKHFGIICGDDLEKIPTTKLYEYAKKFPNSDYLREPEHDYHPGVLSAVYEEFGESGVNMAHGFWWIFCVNSKFTKTIPEVWDDEN